MSVVFCDFLKKVLGIIDLNIRHGVIKNDHCSTKKNEVFHKDFFSKYYQICKKTADLVTITEEILYGKFQFLCSRSSCICFRKKPRKIHVRTYVVNLEGHSTNLKELVVSGLKNEYVMITHITKVVLCGAKRTVLEIA